MISEVVIFLKNDLEMQVKDAQYHFIVSNFASFQATNSKTNKLKKSKIINNRISKAFQKNKKNVNRKYYTINEIKTHRKFKLRKTRFVEDIEIYIDLTQEI